MYLPGNMPDTTAPGPIVAVNISLGVQADWGIAKKNLLFTLTLGSTTRASCVSGQKLRQLLAARCPLLLDLRVGCRQGSLDIAVRHFGCGRGSRCTCPLFRRRRLRWRRRSALLEAPAGSACAVPPCSTYKGGMGVKQGGHKGSSRRWSGEG